MHLTRDALIAFAESRGPARDPHLEACAECRAEVDALRGVLARIAVDEVPEPSPMFWDHFSRRVRTALDAETIAPAPAWHAGWISWTYALGACAAMVLVVAVAWPSRPGERTVPTASDTAAVGEPVAGTALTSDEGWELVVDVAAGDGGDIDPYLAPAGAELGVQDLTSDERTALASLLRAELGGQAGEPDL